MNLDFESKSNDYQMITSYISNKQFIFALDNDECIGSWGSLSILYLYYINNLQISPPIELFAQLIGELKCVRSGLRELYDELLLLKASLRIHSIWMCTAASNSNGWVNFLKKVIECWYGKPIYDNIINGEMIYNYKNKNNYQKDMNQIRELANVESNMPVLMIDDRPSNITNGIAIGVSPYTIAINLINVARAYVKEHKLETEHLYYDVFQSVWFEYLKIPSKFSNFDLDDDLYLCAELIKSF
jgi:hypothetical protein